MAAYHRVYEYTHIVSQVVPTNSSHWRQLLLKTHSFSW